MNFFTNKLCYVELLFRKNVMLNIFFYKFRNINFVTVNFVTTTVFHTVPPPPGGIEKNKFLGGRLTRQNVTANVKTLFALGGRTERFSGG
jgi:hypothetical protein